MIVDFIPTESPFSPVTLAIRFCSKVGSARPLILMAEVIFEARPGERIEMASGTCGMEERAVVGARVGALVGAFVGALVGAAVAEAGTAVGGTFVGAGVVFWT